MTAHTKGPWRQWGNDIYAPGAKAMVASASGNRDDGTVGYVAPDVSDERLAEIGANARLIAAAPDYHEAAVAIVELHDAEAREANFAQCGCRVCVLLRPILAKALGPEPLRGGEK